MRLFVDLLFGLKECSFRVAAQEEEDDEEEKENVELFKFSWDLFDVRSSVLSVVEILKKYSKPK